MASESNDALYDHPLKKRPEMLPGGVKKIYGVHWKESDPGYSPLWADEYVCTADGQTVHCETGPAQRYYDDEDNKLYYAWVWQNQPLPDYCGERVVLRPHELTVAEIDAETDMEVRRVMIERFTPARYLAQTKAKVLDMDSRTVDGGAPRALMETERGDKWLVGTDGSTDRCYYMSVPREAKTCKEAHEMIAGVSEENILAEA